MTFAVAARTCMVSRRPYTCPTTGNILILHKPLLRGRRPKLSSFSREYTEYAGGGGLEGELAVL